MPSILNQKSIRSLHGKGGITFCYLCGRPLGDTELVNRDHVPPRSIFAQEDRFNPLTLPTHASCNGARNVSDDQIRQIFGFKKGIAPSKNGAKFEHHLLLDRENHGKILFAVSSVDIHGEVKRWVRAFHAALYREYLPASARSWIRTPFPTAQLKDDEAVADPFDSNQHKLCVRVIVANIQAGNMDRLVTNKGKVRYECVWSQADNGHWLCFFALDVDNWKELADSDNFEARGCVGVYTMNQSSLPLTATISIELKDKKRDCGLDAFASQEQ